MGSGKGKGTSRGDKANRPVRRRHPDTAAAVEVDHGMLDIVSVDTTGKLPGRPILTVMMDSATCLIVGFTLRFEDRRP